MNANMTEWLESKDPNKKNSTVLKGHEKRKDAKAYDFLIPIILKFEYKGGFAGSLHRTILLFDKEKGECDDF